MQNNSVYQVEETFSGNLNINIMKERTLYHNYAQGNRIAEVYMSHLGREVDLLEDEMFVECRKVHNHSESYAEDVAENWCQGLIKHDEAV